MVVRNALVLISGVTSQLPPGDLVPGQDNTAQASGNAALVVAQNALSSGNLGITNAATALASGNAGISTGLTALASGNAALVNAATALASGNAGISAAASASASASAANTVATAALASGNAALSAVGGKYDKTGGPISGPVVAQSQTFGVPSGTIQGSGVIILNFGARDNFEVVLTASTSTLASPTNASGGQCGALIFRQDSVGSRLLTYSGSWSFVSNTAPSLTTTASGIDMLAYYVVNPNRINIVSNLNFGSGTLS